MSYILIQVKNRKDSRLTGTMREDAVNSLKAAADMLPDHAYIGLFMSLRGKTRQGESAGNEVEVLRPLPDDGTSRSPKSEKGLRRTLSKMSLRVKPEKSGAENQPSSSKSAEQSVTGQANDTNRVVIASVGFDLDLYPGIL